MHHGMLTVYKEAGYTSSDAVARLRGILHMKKIGHTGTLDPDAEGVLPMCLGNATRICELIADREKEYLAVMRLGVKTDTQDMSGTVLFRLEEEEIEARLRRGVESSAADLTVQGEDPAGDLTVQGEDPAGDLTIQGEDPAADRGVRMDNSDKRQTGEGKDPVGDRTSCGEESSAGSVSEDAVSDRIRAAARSFTGEIDQIPPMYSAVKVNGKRLYDMARKGITVERKPRRITIYEICIERIELPFVTMRVRCSKGTYIRTLCEDIGEVLGTGAAMQSLLRTRVGQFTLEDAKRLDEIEQIAKTAPEELAGLIRPVDSFFADLPPAVCPREDLRLLRNGNALDGARLRFPEQSERLEKARITPGGDGQEETRLNRERNSRRHARGERADGGREEARTRGIVRVYDENGVFYGLYRKEQGRERYTAYKMFLPEQK